MLPGVKWHTRRIMSPCPRPPLMSVALVTLGCARNEVDSEELAGRLEADGFLLVDDPDDADTVVVNTCGFVEAPRRTPSTPCSRPPTSRSRGRTQAVVAVGCLAERYGKDLAESLPEADAVLGFDDYPDIAARLRVDRGRGAPPPAHAQDRRKLLPISPGRARRRSRSSVPVTASTSSASGAPASGPRAVRRRLDGGPMAPLKLASGCDRRCSFCAIPSLPRLVRSRRPSDVLAGGAWLADAGRARAVPGQRELHLLRQGPRRPAAARDAAARAQPPSTASSGCASPTSSPPRPGPAWSRRSRRTPGRGAVLRPLLPARQRAVLRRMRRFGDPESFLGLLEQIRALAPRGRRALQRDRRLPRRDRGRPARRCATSSSPPGWT